MDFPSHKASLLDWYATLHADPGWKAHAWHQVQELARQWPTLYGDLPELLRQRKAQESDAPAVTVP